MTKQPLYSVLEQVYANYGIELNEDIFEEQALAAYRKIGNKDVRLKIMRACPQKDRDGGWSICKPCDMDEIEAITLCTEGGQEVSATDDFLAAKTYAIEDWIEMTKHNRDAFYISGMFVKYTEFADKILFTEPTGPVNILYKAQYLDQDGLPFVSDAESEAIQAYLAYCHDLKRARVNKDQNLLQFAQLEYQTFQRLCSKARVADSFSQNEMNEILDTLTSFDVHKYGVSSTKPIK